MIKISMSEEEGSQIPRSQCYPDLVDLGAVAAEVLFWFGGVGHF